MCIVIAREISSLECPCDGWDRPHHLWHLSVIILQFLINNAATAAAPEWSWQKSQAYKTIYRKKNQTSQWLSRNWIVQCLALVKDQSDITAKGTYNICIYH